MATEINIRFRGVQQAFRDLRRELSDEVLENFDSRVIQLTDNLRNNTPVDTGNARDSWFISTILPDFGNPGDFRTVVYNTTDYIDELNMGSSRQAPSRFIEREALRLFLPDGVIVMRSNRRT